MKYRENAIGHSIGISSGLVNFRLALSRNLKTNRNRLRYPKPLLEIIYLPICRRLATGLPTR